jgi:hypothetical protein
VKKLAAVLLVFIYLLSAIGISAERYYCCGKLTYTTYSIGEIQHTDAKSNDKCCKTTKRSFKIKDSHVNGNASSMIAKTMPVILTPFTLDLKSVSEVELPHLAFNANAPPGRQQTPIYILNCTYRI